MSTQPDIQRNGEDGLFLDLGPGFDSQVSCFFEFEFIKLRRQQVTRKPSGPTGRMKMEKDLRGTRDT
jgi:hypothetical protein